MATPTNPSDSISLINGLLDLSPDEAQSFVNYLSSRLRTISQKTFTHKYRTSDSLIYERVKEKSQVEVSQILLTIGVVQAGRICHLIMPPFLAKCMRGHIHLSPEWEVSPGPLVADPLLLLDATDWWSDLERDVPVPGTSEILRRWTANNLEREVRLEVDLQKVSVSLLRDLRGLYEEYAVAHQSMLTTEYERLGQLEGQRDAVAESLAMLERMEQRQRYINVAAEYGRPVQPTLDPFRNFVATTDNSADLQRDADSDMYLDDFSAFDARRVTSEQANRPLSPLTGSDIGFNDFPALDPSENPPPDALPSPSSTGSSGLSYVEPSCVPAPGRPSADIPAPGRPSEDTALATFPFTNPESPQAPQDRLVHPLPIQAGVPGPAPAFIDSGFLFPTNFSANSARTASMGEPPGSHPVPLVPLMNQLARTTRRSPFRIIQTKWQAPSPGPRSPTPDEPQVQLDESPVPEVPSLELPTLTAPLPDPPARRSGYFMEDDSEVEIISEHVDPNWRAPSSDASFEMSQVYPKGEDAPSIFD